MRIALTLETICLYLLGAGLCLWLAIRFFATRPFDRTVRVDRGWCYAENPITGARSARLHRWPAGDEWGPDYNWLSRGRTSLNYRIKLISAWRDA